MRGKRVLIVDDEPDICEIISFELEEDGFEVMTALNGHQGLATYASQKPFDVILSDVRMADGSGIDLLKGIQTLTTNGPPIIFISGFSDIREEEVLKLGAFAILSKPISFDTLRVVIREALAKSSI